MLQFFLDEHVDPAIATGLRRRGIDALTVTGAGRRGLSDLDHVRFCIAAGRVIVTSDPDFLAFHHAGISHAGIVWWPDKRHPFGRAVLLLELLSDMYDPHEMVDRLEHL